MLVCQFYCCKFFLVVVFRNFTSLLACLLACLPACLPTCLPACLHVCLHACVLACLLACLFACLLAGWLAGWLTSFLTYLLTYFLLTYLLTYLLVRLVGPHGLLSPFIMSCRCSKLRIQTCFSHSSSILSIACTIQVVDFWLYF